MWPNTGRHLRDTVKVGFQRGRNKEAGGRWSEKVKAN